MKDIKSVCIVGAGSIGSLYAGHLGSVVDIKILTRRQEHADRLNRQGLQVSGKTQRQVLVQASTNPAELDEAELIIVATKTIDVESSLQRLSGYFPDSLVMLVQNGLGCENMVANYGDWSVISAVTFMAGTRHSDVHVEYELDTATWLGPWIDGSASCEDAQRVSALLKESGLKAKSFDDLRPAQWSKLIFNATVNSIAAATDLPFCRHYVEREKIEDLGHLVYNMMTEGKRVAEACGISLHMDPWSMAKQVVEQSQKVANDGRIPSMLADVRAKRPTEIDWITGAIVTEATKAGIHVPLNETLYRLIKSRESQWHDQI